MSTTPQIAAVPQDIPPELDRWNWGAFFLNWIWGIGNGTPIALITLIPGVGLIMMMVLGFRGSRWAWRNKRWDSVEQFKRVQRHWAIAGLIVWLAGIALLVAIFAGTFALINDSEAYKLGAAQLQASPLATNALGTPITVGASKHASISIENDSGKASLDFPVSGPKGSGTAYVEAVKKSGVWSLTRLYFKLDGKDGEIDIIGGGNSST
jgi:hypothetical protein